MGLELFQCLIPRELSGGFLEDLTCETVCIFSDQSLPPMLFQVFNEKKSEAFVAAWSDNHWSKPQANHKLKRKSWEASKSSAIPGNLDDLVYT